MKPFFSASVLAAVLASACIDARAATVFLDDFNSAPNAAWGNEYGGWSTTGGVYNAQQLDVFPATRSLVSSLTLSDFTVTVNVNNAQNGGVWLRARNTSGPIGVEGILLTTQAGYLYWHAVENGSYGPAFGGTNPSVTPIPNSYELKVEVQGGQYSAFVNGALVSTIVSGTYSSGILVSNSFSSGLVGLYDFSTTQTFDNFKIEAQSQVPVPAALPLFASAVIGGGVIAWRRKPKQKT